MSIIESFGSTSLVEVGTNYYLYNSSGVGPSLKYQGVTYTAGQFGQWTPTGVEQTASGYEVAWVLAGANAYAVWSTDSNGNFTSILLNTVAGTDPALESIETSFHQDLNGDGVISPPSTTSAQTVIESSGATSLVEVGTNYYLEDSSGAGPSLKYGGAAYVAGQFGQWTPIGVEQTASGYEVAWKMAGADQYAVWLTDSNGNYVSNTLSNVSGTTAALESVETGFHQDLNGDGVIGPPSAPAQTVIESAGATSLVEVGNNFYLYDSSGAGPSLKYQGAAVVAGQFGQWTPIGAEQTTTGYEVALKVAGADQYTVWATDSNGNYTSNIISTVAGTDPTLESLESSFHQDLNSDGLIGPGGAVSPPQFVYQGLDSSGAQVYDVIWSTSGEQPFAVRVLTPEHPSTNLPHTFLYALPVQAGLAQPTWGSGLNELQKLDVEDQYNATIIEPIFPTDPWYADNVTDPTMNYETFMANILPAWVDSHFSTSGGAEDNLLIGFSKSGYGAVDLELKHPSVFSAVAAWDFPADDATYTDFGANGNYGTEANFQDNYRLTGSFLDTWKAPFTTQDRIWISGYSAFPTDISDFDSLLTSHGVLHTLAPQTFDTHSWSGGWLASAVSGLYGLVESNFQAGPPPSQTVIESSGATSLVEVGTNYYLEDSSGAGPSLKYGGATYVAGQFGQWTPIGVEQTASGYEAAWKVAGADQYAVWLTDSNGNYVSNTLSNVSGTSAALESVETSFHQDLNGDGVIGPPVPSQTVIESSGATSLVEVGNNFYLYGNSGAGPSLKYQGAAVVAGQFGQWTPIGAEQTTTGYEVALKVAGADQYTIWATDSNGNYTSNIINTVAGTDATLQSLEPSFHQDLNSDGRVGLVGASPTVLDGHTGGQTLTASGPSTLIGGPNDVLNGGPGADTFVFQQNFGANVVNNFTPLVDTLEFSQSAFANAAGILGDAQQVGSDVVITQAAQDVVTLQNVQLANLHATDFLLV
jgi:hypothetical protein